MIKKALKEEVDKQIENIPKAGNQVHVAKVPISPGMHLSGDERVEMKDREGRKHNPIKDLIQEDMASIRKILTEELKVNRDKDDITQLKRLGKI